MNKFYTCIVYLYTYIYILYIYIYRIYICMCIYIYTYVLARHQLHSVAHDQQHASWSGGTLRGGVVGMGRVSQSLVFFFDIYIYIHLSNLIQKGRF